MKIIGITGGIGAGKSRILSYLEEKHNGYCIEADRVAHTLMEPGGPVYLAIRNAFPADILDDDDRIHRQKMADLIFRQPQMREKLNAIVHPAVKAYIRSDIQRCRQEGNITLYVLEAALLIEDGYREICDELWYVYSPEEVRIARLMESRGYSREKCMQIVNSQSTDTYYRRHCDRILVNDGNLENAKKQVEEFLMNL